MKRYLFILILPIIFSAASCTKTQSVAPVIPNQTILTSISANNWQTNDGGKTYYAIINTPEINKTSFTYDGVLTYITFDNATYEQVPEVYGGIAYSFTHSVGKIEIDIQSSDGKTLITPPGNLGVKIVLIPSY